MPPKKNQHDIFAIPKGVPRWPAGDGKCCVQDAAGAECHSQTEQLNLD